jgi:hypothetical protein
MNFSKLIVSALIPSAIVIAVVSPARANCARPVGYDATVTGNTVQVTPVNFGNRACPDANGMLRQAVDTGAVVKLADFCVPTSELAAYVDECVPPGTYRYGFATPYECESSACSTSYFAEAKVTDTLSDTCARSDGNAEPATATSVPWQDDSLICDYDEGTGGSGGYPSGAGGAGGQPSGAGGAGGQPSGAGGAGADNDTGKSSGGCSVALTPGAGSVLGANALALVVGIALMRARRGKQA